MFELITSKGWLSRAAYYPLPGAAAKRPTLRERIRRAGERCIGLTRWQRLARAWFWACLGSSLTMIAIAIGQPLEPVPPVTLLQPVIAHASPHYTVYRLRLKWREAEKFCELTVFHDRQTWRLSCEPY